MPDRPTDASGPGAPGGRPRDHPRLEAHGERLKRPVARSLERSAPEAALPAVLFSHLLKLLPAGKRKRRVWFLLAGAAQGEHAGLITSG